MLELDELATGYIRSWVKGVAKQNYPTELALIIKIMDLYDLVGDFDSEYEDLEQGFRRDNFSDMLADELTMLPGRCPFTPELEDGSREIAQVHLNAYKGHYVELQDRLGTNRALRNKTKEYITKVGETAANQSLAGAAFIDTFPTLDAVTQHLRGQMLSFNDLMSYSMLRVFPPDAALASKPFLDRVSELRVVLAQEIFSPLYTGTTEETEKEIKDGA